MENLSTAEVSKNMPHDSIDEQTAFELIEYIASVRIPLDAILKRNREIRQVLIWANRQHRWDILIRVTYHATYHFAYADTSRGKNEKTSQTTTTNNQLWLQGIEFALAGLTATLRANDPYHEKLFLEYLARLSQSLGNYETARQYFECQLALNNNPKSKQEIAQRLFYLGNAAKDKQEYAIARKCYQKSVDIYQSIGNQYAMANIIAFMAVNEEKDGNIDLMQHYIEQSENLRKQVTSIKSKL